ncbi:hypothetical protein, partial [Enterococcus faecium]|uniref:hypothetical protein n=1 Tax=Enterococcus faecium TaxID=1352 RepID=UPI0021D7B7A2
KNIVLLTEINGFFDASLLHNYMDVIQRDLIDVFFCANRLAHYPNSIMRYMKLYKIMYQEWFCCKVLNKE